MSTSPSDTASSHDISSDAIDFQTALSYVKKFQPRRWTNDDEMQLLELQDTDEFNSIRHQEKIITCSVCTSFTRNSQVMSLCCRMLNCLACVHDTFQRYNIHCPSCGINWAAFEVNQVLMQPITSKPDDIDETKKNELEEKWKTLVIGVFQRREERKWHN